MFKKTIKFSLAVTPEVDSALEEMSESAHSSKSDILRKAIALMKVAIQEEKRGNHIGIISHGKIINQIIGIL